MRPFWLRAGLAALFVLALVIHFILAWLPYASRELPSRTRIMVPEQRGIAAQSDFPVLPFSAKDLYPIAQKGDLDAILARYDRENADINASLDPGFQKPLFAWLMTWNWPLAKALCRRRTIDLASCPDFMNYAVSSRDPEAVRLLIALKAPVEPKTPMGSSPILKAVQLGELEIVKILEENGADLYGDFRGMSAMDIAVLSRFTTLPLLAHLESRNFHYTTRHLEMACHHARNAVLRHILEACPELMDSNPIREELVQLAITGHGTQATLDILSAHGCSLRQGHFARIEKRQATAHRAPSPPDDKNGRPRSPILPKGDDPSENGPKGTGNRLMKSPFDTPEPPPLSMDGKGGSDFVAQEGRGDRNRESRSRPHEPSEESI